VFDADDLVSEEQTHDVQPISVALPFISSEATIDSQQTHEPSLETHVTNSADSDVEDEDVTQVNLTLDSFAPFVLECVHDPPFVKPNFLIVEVLNTDSPSSSTQANPQPETVTVSPPPTLLLDSIVLEEVCENIFEDLSKLVKARNYLIHTENYEEKWTALRERVDTVMCELQKLSLKAHDQSVNNLNN